MTRLCAPLYAYGRRNFDSCNHDYLTNLPRAASISVLYNRWITDISDQFPLMTYTTKVGTTVQGFDPATA